MKTLQQIIFLAFFVFAAQLAAGQEEKPQNSTTKANHNTTRSNKKAIAVPDKDNNGNVTTDDAVSGKAQNHNSSRSNKSVVDKPDASSAAQSKKGYDYYKANSDNVRKRPGGTKDHNSSRSNKTASQADPDEPTDSGDLTKSDVEQKTNKSEAARSKRK